MKIILILIFLIASPSVFGPTNEVCQRNAPYCFSTQEEASKPCNCQWTSCTVSTDPDGCYCANKALGATADTKTCQSTSGAGSTLKVYYKKIGLGALNRLGNKPCTNADTSGCFTETVDFSYSQTENKCTSSVPDLDTMGCTRGQVIGFDSSGNSICDSIPDLVLESCTTGGRSGVKIRGHSNCIRFPASGGGGGDGDEDEDEEEVEVTLPECDSGWSITRPSCDRWKKQKTKRGRTGGTCYKDSCVCRFTSGNPAQAYCRSQGFCPSNLQDCRGGTRNASGCYESSCYTVSPPEQPPPNTPNCQGRWSNTSAGAVCGATCDHNDEIVNCRKEQDSRGCWIARYNCKTATD